MSHELLHAFLHERELDLEATAQRCKTGRNTIDEGLAYAVSPPLLHPDLHGPDQLASWVDAADGRSSDEASVRYHRVALLVRPTLVQALAGDVDLTSLLDATCSASSAVAEARTYMP